MPDPFMKITYVCFPDFFPIHAYSYGCSVIELYFVLFALCMI